MAASSSVAWKTAQPFPRRDSLQGRALTPALSHREKGLSERVAASVDPAYRSAHQWTGMAAR